MKGSAKKEAMPGGASPVGIRKGCKTDLNIIRPLNKGIGRPVIMVSAKTREEAPRLLGGLFWKARGDAPPSIAFFLGGPRYFTMVTVVGPRVISAKGQLQTSGATSEYVRYAV